MNNTTRIAALLMLSVSLLGLSRHAYSTAADAPICVHHDDNTGTETGCWNKPCPGGGTFLEPAEGYIRSHTYTCCKDSNGVVSGTDYGCHDDDNLNCCSLVADAPACPGLYCHPASEWPSEASD